MPVYEYECSGCQKVFEVQQRISDEPLTQCPECEGEVKKIISMTSFQLKGGGWYADGYASASAGKEKKTAVPAAAPAAAPCSAGGSCAGCPASTS
jgi:putative FmdB family regulatory protein